MSEFVLGTLVGVLVGLLILAGALILTGNASNKDAEWRGVCEYKHGHVAIIDHDHKVCLVNGKVVKW